jgi:hypothetical protein
VRAKLGELQGIERLAGQRLGRTSRRNGRMDSAAPGIWNRRGQARRVAFVNEKVPRSWEGSNNAVLATGVTRYPNARLVDWHDAGVDHPEYFWADGIHLRPEGAAAYAVLIAREVVAP